MKRNRIATVLGVITGAILCLAATRAIDIAEDPHAPAPTPAAAARP